MKGCRPLTDAEIHTVLAQLDRSRYPLRDRALFLLGIRSGFRISELLSLRLSDVCPNGRFVDRIYIDRSRVKKKIEGQSVPVHPEARAALEAWVKELARAGHTAPETFVFRSQQGENKAIDRRWAWRFFRKAYTLCQMTGKLGTHSMRKTFAKRVHEKLGRDLVKTQRAMRHKDINSTVSYLSFADEEIDDAILKS